MSAPERFRMLPASDIGERGLVCSLLLDLKQVGAMCAERGLTPRHFHNPGLATIYGYLLAEWNEGRAVDVVTMTQALADRKQLEQVGGAAFIAEMYTFLPTATQAGQYIETLEEKFILREMIATCTLYASRSYEEQQDPRGLLAELMGSVSDLAGLTTRSGYVPMKTRVLDKMDRMESAEQADNYVLTGLGKLDHLSPLRRGDMALITGEEKAGKSFLACSIARYLLRNGGACFYATLEQADYQEVDRLLHGYVRVPIAKDHASKLSEHDMVQFQKITEAASWRLDLRDNLHDLSSVIAGMRQAKARWPDLQLIVVDYGQLVKGFREKGDTREMEMSSVSRTIRRTIGELKCAGLLLSQLNKDGESRESKAFEQDMTARWHIERIPYPAAVAKRKDPEEMGKFDNDNDNLRILGIPKQRNGKGRIGFKVSFDGAIGVVSDLVNEPIQTELTNDDQWS